MIVSCILRKSVAFGPEHVYWLRDQVHKHMPEAWFIPYSDVPLDNQYRPLTSSLPSWWAKMEALRGFTEDTSVLMLDLDTVIVKPWTIPAIRTGQAYMPTFPGRKGEIFGCWQFSSSEFRAAVTNHFFSDPERWIEESEGCDQKYYAKHHLDRITPINHLFPDLCVSYKLQAKPHGLWPQTSFVLFHGLPRPWQVEHPWIPPLEKVA